ncbi:MAG: helix-hairpin-helix domain-containing protein [Bacteroidales bacterium]|nr:helix-hairpin-helix domain-containing protein [Bacteroidales bacterium]
MKLNIEPIRNWFGFTRRERRSTFILMIIAFLILGLRYTVPEKNLEIKDLSDSILYNEERKAAASLKEEKSKTSGRPEYVAPNNADRKPVYQKRPVVNLNSCDTSQLISLPGIGPVLSVRIIKYRNLLGGFASVDQLKEVYGLSAETFELIQGRVYADSSDVNKININEATYKDLSRLPYFEKYEVTAILKYRELNGRINGINNLTDNKLIPVEKVSKVRPYLIF